MPNAGYSNTGLALDSGRLLPSAEAQQEKLHVPLRSPCRRAMEFVILARDRGSAGRHSSKGWPPQIEVADIHIDTDSAPVEDLGMRWTMLGEQRALIQNG